MPTQRYELILDHKRTRLRTAELALARQAADAETPPAFSPPPGAHTPTTPSGGYGGHAAPGGGTHQPPLGGVFGAAASPATALQIQAQQQRLAEQATQALMKGAAAPAPAGSAGAGPMSAGTGDAGGAAAAASGATSARRRRWYLGIQSKKEPAHVMTEVYKALLQLGCEWKILDSYRVRCRWRPNQQPPAMAMSAPTPFGGGGATATGAGFGVGAGAPPKPRKPPGDAGVDESFDETELHSPHYLIKISLTLCVVRAADDTMLRILAHMTRPLSRTHADTKCNRTYTSSTSRRSAAMRLAS